MADDKFNDEAIEVVNAIGDYADIEFVSPVIEAIAAALRQSHADGRAEAVQAAVKCVPSNWLDSQLASVLSKEPITTRDIEILCNLIRKEIAALIPSTDGASK